jgi:transposase
VLDVEQWAELRRERAVRGVGVRELARRFAISRNTVRVASRSERPPAFRCPERASTLDSFKEEIHERLRRDPLPAVRVREVIEPLGFVGGQTIVNDYTLIAPSYVGPATECGLRSSANRCGPGRHARPS